MCVYLAKENHMLNSLPEPSGSDPSLKTAVETLFTPEEKEKLRANLIERQIAQAKYLREHPEISSVMRSAISQLVKDKPADPILYLTDYFLTHDLEEVERINQAREADKQWRTQTRKEEAANEALEAHVAAQKEQEKVFTDQLNEVKSRN